MGMDDRRQRTAGEHIVDDAEIVEYLERAGLDPIASRPKVATCVRSQGCASPGPADVAVVAALHCMQPVFAIHM